MVKFIFLIFLVQFMAPVWNDLNEIAIANEDDGGDEEPCDCGTMGPGECAPCPEDGD